MRFKPVAIVICAISLNFVTGCSSKSAAVEMIEGVDAISISASASPEYSRVVALANGSAEIIASLGHLDILIGRDIASDVTSLESVEVVTSGHQIVAEKILSLKPDLVLIDASSGPSSALTVIAGAGIRIAKISEAWSLNDINRKVSEIAKAIGVVDDGKSLIAALQGSTSAMKQISPGKTIAFLSGKDFEDAVSLSLRAGRRYRWPRRSLFLVIFCRLLQACAGCRPVKQRGHKCMTLL